MTREEQLEVSLQEAWAELERKQGYLETAFDEAQRLKNELDILQAAQSAAGDQGALENAWAELARKQKYLEDSLEEIKIRDQELELLRGQIADASHTPSSFVAPDVKAALQKAWNELEARDGQILELKAELVSSNAALDAAQARIEWLTLENTTLANVVGVDKMRQ